MAVFLFLVHCLRGDFWELQKGLLVPFPENHVLVLIFFFEIQIRRAALIDNTLDVIAVDLVNVLRYLVKNSFRTPRITNVLALQVSNDHSSIEAVVDGARRRQIDSLL
jgi:hypothetical protein